MRLPPSSDAKPARPKSLPAPGGRTKEPLYVRVSPALIAKVKALAASNRRSLVAEVEIALEAHVA